MVLVDLVHRLAFHQRHRLPSNRACLAEVPRSLSPQPHCMAGSSSCYFPILRGLHGHPAVASVKFADHFSCRAHTPAECILILQNASSCCSVHACHSITSHRCASYTCNCSLAHRRILVVLASADETRYNYMLISNA